MRRSISALALALAIGFGSAGLNAAAAQSSGSSYDWRSGNSYNWNRNYDGSTTVRGFNSQTGSMWNNTIQRNGDQRGMDSHGNLWNYNAATGSYMNSNGHGCIGQGYARSCW